MTKANNGVMDFFHNKVVLLVESIVLALSTIGLTIGGIKAEDIQQIGSLAVAALTAVDAVITFIAATINKKDKKEV